MRLFSANLHRLFLILTLLAALGLRAQQDVPSYQNPEWRHVTVENAKAGEYLSICPNVCELADGTLLLAYHRTTRVDFSGDYSTWTRFSRDGGLTWSEPRLVMQHLQAPGLLRSKGELLLNGCTVIDDRWSTTMRLFRSLDAGTNWVEQKPIWEKSKGIRLQGGCASLIRLRSGRIICPVFGTDAIAQDYSAATEGMKAWCYFSDDEARTWKQSQGKVALPQRGAMEPSVAETAVGALVMTLRTQLGSVYVSRSDDHGETWATPWSSGLEAPEAPLTMISFPDGKMLLLVYCSGKFDPKHHHSGERTPLTSAVSRDAGKTWQKLADTVGGPHEFGATTICFTKKRQRNRWLRLASRSMGSQRKNRRDPFGDRDTELVYLKRRCITGQEEKSGPALMGTPTAHEESCP